MTRNQYAKLFADQHKIYEETMRRIFLKALRNQVKTVLDWIRNNGSTNAPLEGLINRQIFRQPLVQAYTKIGLIAAKREYYFQRGENKTKSDIEFLVTEWRTFFIQYATNYAYRVENDLSGVTMDALRDALREAYEQNLNTDRTITYLRKKVYNQINRTRAARIARTETTTAANMAKKLGAESYLNELGERGYKQWIGRSDARERHTHMALNDKIIPMDELWQVGNDVADAPGALTLSKENRIQCRCTQLFMSESLYRRRYAK